MRSVFLRSLMFLVIAGVCAIGAMGAGYFIHKQRIDPVFSFAERAEGRLRRDLNLASDTVGFVERIETIFLNLRGKVYTMPGQDFLGGGALAIWGDDVLTLHMLGNVFYLDEDEGMILSNIKVPDNGQAAFLELTQTDKYAAQAGTTKSLRYHDIEYIDNGTHRGLILSYPYVDVERECYFTRLSWLPLPDEIASIRDLTDENQNWETLFDSNPCIPFNERGSLLLAYMAGGRLAYREPNHIYLGHGEYHLDGIYRPDIGIQDDAVDYGKVLEIDLDTRASRVYSKGHRNLQGVTVDAQGRIWTTEHGMRGGDELNLIVEGENYGWPLEDMGTLYNGLPALSIPGSGPGRHTVYKAPVFAFVPSAAISSVEALDGFHETWDGDLLITSLKARTLYRARPDGDRLVSLEPIPIGQRIRDVMQWGERIVLWLDTSELVVLEIEPREDPLAGMEEAMTPVLGADMAQRVTQELNGCAECHSYEEDIHGAGPSLYRVYNRTIAGTAFAYYSDELKTVTGKWDTQTLKAFLQDPEALAPNTIMSNFAISDPEIAAGMTRALEWLHQKQTGAR